MNNEPVTYLKKDESTGFYYECDKEYGFPVYTHPVKELHLSLQKSKQTGELLAVTYTDDEHRIVEVLWQRPPELTDVEIAEQQAEIEKLRNWVEMLVEVPFFNAIDHYRGIPVAIIRKEQEK